MSAKIIDFATASKLETLASYERLLTPEEANKFHNYFIGFVIDGLPTSVINNAIIGFENQR